jgi:NADPH:quinone reductase
MSDNEFSLSHSFYVGYMTAYHGLIQRGNLKANEVVLVTGAGGGMGLSAIQIAKLCGARVIAAASEDVKLEGKWFSTE